MNIRDQCPVCNHVPTKVKSVVRAGKVALCNNCSSWYRVPRPRHEDLIGIYNKDYYNSWGLDKSEDSVKATKTDTFTPVLLRIENELSKNNDSEKSLLDIGAATGIFLQCAAEKGWSPYAVELNPYSASLLREQFGQNRVFMGELVDCTFNNKHFDAITMTDVIEHVLDIDRTLKTAHSLLDDAGIICITTPRIDSLSRYLMGSQWLHFKEEHIQYFSKKAIAMALTKAGFTDIKITTHSKYLTMNYLYNQLVAFPHWLLTPIIKILHTILPAGLRKKL